jgi:hypothetical protein
MNNTERVLRLRILYLSVSGTERAAAAHPLKRLASTLIEVRPSDASCIQILELVARCVRHTLISSADSSQEWPKLQKVIQCLRTEQSSCTPAPKSRAAFPDQMGSELVLLPSFSTNKCGTIVITGDLLDAKKTNIKCKWGHYSGKGIYGAVWFTEHNVNGNDWHSSDSGNKFEYVGISF